MNVIRKKLGFFDEMSKEEAQAVIRSGCNNEEYPEMANLLRYMSSGHGLLAVPGIVSDVLSEEREIIGSPDVLTDGEWVWTADVVHYIKCYHYRPPMDFVFHAQENGWVVPTLEDISTYTVEGWGDSGDFV